MRIEYELLSPLSHIGETASSGTYFQTILTSSGRIPVVTGNSIRGTLRDCMARHLLDTLGGVKVSKEIFHVLFSGGNIVVGMKNDVGKAKAIRQHFPMISLLGGGLGDMLMAGKMQCGFVYPVCQETADITGVMSNLSWHNLIEEIEFTRMDDVKNDKLAGKYCADTEGEAIGKASQQMRFSVQYLAAGTKLVQDISFTNPTDLEMGAFFAGVHTWFINPYMGGMSAKGFGKFRGCIKDDNGNVLTSVNPIPESQKVSELIDAYESFILSEGGTYLSLLQVAKKEAKKGGKKADKPVEDNWTLA